LNYQIFNLSKQEDIDIFYLNKNKNDIDGHSAFPAVNLWSVWNNVLVCHTWEQAEIAAKLTTNTIKVFYMYNIDWHDQQIHYPEQMDILSKMDKVVCRSGDHAKLIHSHFGVTAEISENYNFNDFMKDFK